MTIPKIIHYCWFGSKSKPKSVQKYIDNWHQMLPDYQFMEWNEENCDLDNEIDYVKEAYAAKKYAFVSDYIRVQKLYQYGGIYLDTDVKILKRFDHYLENTDMVLGFQGTGNILTAFIATKPHHPLLSDFLHEYESRHFLLDDGSYDMTSINLKMDRLVEKCGINLNSDCFQSGNLGIVIYPSEVFCAFDLNNWHPIITPNTHTVHYMASSWRGNKIKLKIMIINLSIRIIGPDNYDKLKYSLKHIGRKRR